MTPPPTSPVSVQHKARSCCLKFRIPIQTVTSEPQTFPLPVNRWFNCLLVQFCTMLSSAIFRRLVRPFHSQSIWLQRECIMTEKLGFFAEFHKFPKYAKHHRVLHVWIPPATHKPSIPEWSKCDPQRRQWDGCYIVQNTGQAANFMSNGQAPSYGAKPYLPPATHKQIRPKLDAVS